MDTKVEKFEIEGINEEEIDHEKEDEYEIKYWGYSRSVNEIYSMYKDAEIIIPTLQRDYVWSYVQASLFIDSILRGLPIPSLFITQVANKYLLIDGLQRIHTLRLYIDGTYYDSWEKTGEFKLSSSQDICSKWAGKAYKELDVDTSKRFVRAMLHLIEFLQVSPMKNYTAMYNIFERINSTGKSLSSQEVRNAAYYGSYNDFLIQKNKEKNWLSIFKIIDTRMKDIELILRFLSIKQFVMSYEKIKLPKSVNLKRMLNEYMACFQALELYGESFDKTKFRYFGAHFEGKNANELIKFDYEWFDKTFEWISCNIGENAFKRPNDIVNGKQDYIDRIHPTIFEGLSIAVFYILYNKKPILNEKDWEKSRCDKLSNCNFDDLFVYNTMKTQNIINRVNLFIVMISGEKHVISIK